jgi:peptidoglycan/LPS O-acetylase OafA/YrhL
MIGGLATSDERLLHTGNEAGTAPGDRRFRPDVQGLRAVAILLVVLFHAGIPGISGGYVGVDVFFVISGFVITGLLLREHGAGRRTSFLHFYSRRARRIIPAASVVIIVTVIAAFHYLGSLTGHDTAIDGQWASVFLANFHFAASQTNYLASQRPPSALQNYWSLAVEEQFYIVYPTVFLVAASLVTRISLRVRLAILLATVIVASYAFSIVFTSANPSSAFFSPLTRAWELALGGLIAVGSNSLRRLPRSLAAFLSWLGLAAIVTASVTLTSASAYPGALVAIPVVGAGLIIAAGTSQPAWGVEYLLRQKPFQLLGLISYSLYLWHWPILIIATQNRGATSLPVWDNVVLLLVATLAATVTYRLIENPIRHSRRLIQRRWASLIMGLCVIGATLVVTTYQQHRTTVNLGVLQTVGTGSVCTSPSAGLVSKLRSTHTSGHPARKADSDLQPVMVVGDSTACTLLPGLQAVGPSYGMQFKNGAVIGCGVVSGEIAPIYASTGLNMSAPTTRCQGEANRAETAAIERYRPRLIIWGSTEEHDSIVDETSKGTRIVESGSSTWRSVMLQRIDDRVKKFVATGARVILVLEPPSAHAPGSQAKVDSTDVQYEQMNNLLREVAARHPKEVAVVNLQARVCPSGPPCLYVVDGFGSTVATEAQAIRPDGIHYLPSGALWVAKWLVPRIASAAAKLS